MAEVIEFAKPEAQAPATGGFVMTESAQEMLRSLQLVRAAGNAITLIAAAPGTGKTEVLKHFTIEQNREAKKGKSGWVDNVVHLHTAVAGEGSPWGLACQLMQAWNQGPPNGRRLMETRQRIGECVGRGGLLLLDEAQYLVQRNPRGKICGIPLNGSELWQTKGVFPLLSAAIWPCSKLPHICRNSGGGCVGGW